ncbi:hypothetical protein AKJ57_02255 [candidate division MSBL1 archaeon SCGC-AAA259A05]|uniref:Uncharacterized protein n=1 Tax=candidate division MSBL1 archaeon SCGC-AAA259A05 TaxID=1698259 RepID=A0A133UAB9_9EURY|nr:hypothetical protein AKJ57_02255 [candidate division MSBL1 archaeon SCGC-AAA259A05]
MLKKAVAVLVLAIALAGGIFCYKWTPSNGGNGPIHVSIDNLYRNPSEYYGKKVVTFGSFSSSENMLYDPGKRKPDKSKFVYISENPPQFAGELVPLPSSNGRVYKNWGRGYRNDTC